MSQTVGGAKSKHSLCCRIFEGLLRNLRPLGEVTLVGDPALFVRTYSVVDIGAPGHVGKHFEQVFHLVWRERTISVLKRTECTCMKQTQGTNNRRVK